MNRKQRRQAERRPSGDAHVAIAYLHGSTVSAAFTMCLMRTLLYEGSRSNVYPRVIATRCGTLGLVDGRNQSVKTFLDDTSAEWLWMVDSDMGFAPGIIHQLEDSADPELRPFVGGLCFANKRSRPDDTLQAERWDIVPTVYRFEEREDDAGFAAIVDYPADTMMEVHATGAACLLMHRSGLEKLRAKFGDVWFDQVDHPKAKRFSEDLSFCMRTAAAGIPLWVNTAAKTAHDKGGVFLTEELFRAQQDRAAQS